VREEAGGLRFESAGGELELTGWDVQRTPGDKGWGFASALAPAAPATGRRFVAGQAGAWSLVLEADGSLVAEIAGARLAVPGPEPGRCTPVALFAWFDRPLLPGKPRSAAVDLYVDGRLAAAVAPAGEVPDAALASPTRVAGGDSGAAPFVGWMAEPRLTRFRLGPEEAAALGASLCPR
jgi:hypothetical protein